MGDAMERIIFHIDVNSAFLSWEAVYRITRLGQEGDIRQEAAVIGGDESMRHGIVLAKSELAKSYGVETGEPIARARSKCPNLKTYPTRFDWYVTCSAKLMDLIRSKSVSLEQFSIDEAWCDMTGLVDSRQAAVDYAVSISREVKETLGFTVNIGISTNKLLAKMASGFKKPDMVHTLFPDEIKTKMWPLKVDKLMYVGGSTKKKLESLGIRTIGQLASIDIRIIETHLKKHGRMIHNYANGIDDSPVAAEREENKGYGNSMTIPYDVVTRQDAGHVILSLTETLCARMRNANVRASVLAVSYVDTDFTKRSKQCSLENSIVSVAAVYEEAMKLLDVLWDKATPLRQLGVYAMKITREEYHQYTLFEDVAKQEKQEKLDDAIARIRKKFGDNAVFRASYMDSSIPHISEGLSRKKDTTPKD